MTIPAALLCLALSVLCAALFLGLIRVRRAVTTLNLQIEQQRTQRAEIDAIKDELIANVSHELRTPLTSIRGSLGLLSAGLAGSLDPKGQHLLRIAVTNTDRLIRLVTDILDLERMQSGQATLHLRRCSLSQLIHQAMEAIAPTAEAAGVSICFTMQSVPDPPTQGSRSPDEPLDLANEPQLPLAAVPEEGRTSERRASVASVLSPASSEAGELAYFDADPDRILQILANLLSNALKFSPPSSTVTLKLLAGTATLHLRVVDEGRGIPEEKLEVIFDRFQQVEITDARQKGGTGLGLAICRTLVQQHGGAIWAERNASGVGATLCVDLPRIRRFSDQAQDVSEPVSMAT